MALARKLAATRKRLDTAERLLEARNLVLRCEIKTYAPIQVAIKRGLWTHEYLGRILRIVQQEGKALCMPRATT